MHFSTLVITTTLIAASSTMAYDPCPAHTYPKCCGTDILGLADLDCSTSRDSPTSFEMFANTCAQQGKEPKCCAIPVGGQALFCVPPIPSRDPSPAAPNNQRPLGDSPAAKAAPSPAATITPGNGNPDSGNPPAMMANSSPGSSSVCPSMLYSNVQCCGTDVLGVADLDCATPHGMAQSGKDLQSICAQSGKQAACCTLPLLGQGLLCTKPVGV